MLLILYYATMLSCYSYYTGIHATHTILCYAIPLYIILSYTLHYSLYITLSLYSLLHGTTLQDKDAKTQQDRVRETDSEAGGESGKELDSETVWSPVRLASRLCNGSNMV